MNQSSRSNPPPPPPPGGDSRHDDGGGGGDYYQGGGGRRRPYPAINADERFQNNYDPRGPQNKSADDSNNWGHEQQYEQQQQHHQGASPSSNFRGGRGSGGRGGGGRPPSDQHNQRGHHHHQKQQRKNDPQQPLPPDQRRTLVLANVPPHLKHYHIKSHFSQNWGIPVNYALVDKHSGLAYVRFETVDDAKQVWVVGTNGLDGPNYSNVDNGGGGGEHQDNSSLLSEGIVLQEVYFTNFVPNDNKKYDDAQSSSAVMSRKHGRGADEYSGRERGGGGGYSDYHPDERDSKMARRHSGQYPTQQHPASSYTNPSNNSYKRTAEQKHHQQQLTPEELELKKQKQQEYQKQYEAFQTQEQEWRKRRNAEYQAFATAKNERTSQISTLQHKKELQSKQETMLAKQLPLHKKMLSMLKSKNAPASEQSKKMKEILGAQTQLLQLKKDRKSTVEELEKLKEEERVKGVFVPSEKRPVFVASGDSAGVQKRSLDRRSTVLRVEGFEEKELDEETMKAELKEHFSTFGAVSDVSLETDQDGDNVSTSVFALVHFSTRLDAEKAKESGTNFKEVPLKCSWHHESSSSTPHDGDDAEGDAADSVGDGAEESNYHDDLYDDDQVEESYGDYFAGEGLPAGEEHDMVDYDYGGDEDMVDYD
mmetsp:Transcript_11318/g.22597  ORF Transcript_11318/g.22597 Transcript_11318/m.22597 type:complete len:649 (-) Transcript_11318:36-1982(-)